MTCVIYVVLDAEMNYRLSLTFIIVSIMVITLAIAPVAAEPLKVSSFSTITYLTYQQLTEMPEITEYAELYCYGNLVTSGEWVGIQLSILLDQIGVSPDVNSVQFTAADLYSIAIPLQVAVSPQTIIAYQKDGVPLLEGLRLVLPGYNGASWICQIVSISLSSDVIVAPASISIDGTMPRSVLRDFDGKSFAPIPTYTPTPPSPLPETKNPTPNLTINPKDNSEVEPTPKLQTVNQPQSKDLDQMSIALVFVIILIGLLTAILVYRTNMKDRLINRCN